MKSKDSKKTELTAEEQQQLAGYCGCCNEAESTSFGKCGCCGGDGWPYCSASCAAKAAKGQC